MKIKNYPLTAGLIASSIVSTYFVLPNTMDGDWKSAICEYGRLSEVEKTAKRANALESY